MPNLWKTAQCAAVPQQRTKRPLQTSEELIQPQPRARSSSMQSFKVRSSPVRQAQNSTATTYLPSSSQDYTQFVKPNSTATTSSTPPLVIVSTSHPTFGRSTSEF
ncbi:unnamed protein product [Cylicocyclus nassatus]|uniref:Uncharacterized protein n=1 Tax=Cylicocyclus nassatus TaxID=53992 RepID=A0AA36GNV0_CYLNA|nr:unnamed protein product [Cylicocyclus nassatus]